METLPEFRVTLTRMKQGEKAYPVSEHAPDYDYHGQRTKLGGDPDWEQYEEVPVCDGCKEQMTFVAQIDSVEHDWDSNPHSVDILSGKQKWMFGDVGMIYVSFCFDCPETRAF